MTKAKPTTKAAMDSNAFDAGSRTASLSLHPSGTHHPRGFLLYIKSELNRQDAENVKRKRM